MHSKMNVSKKSKWLIIWNGVSSTKFAFQGFLKITACSSTGASEVVHPTLPDALIFLVKKCDRGINIPRKRY